MLLILILIMSMLFLFMNHPLSMGMILLIQTLLISITSGMFNLNFWYSYIILLIMVGGMLILFIYMTSIASNEKFKFSNKLMYLMTMMFIMLNMLMLNYDKMMIYIKFNNYDFLKFIDNNNIYYSMIKYYNLPLNFIMLMIIIYLLITLIAVVKITNIKNGPLRQMF
uniref:NADH-ubiquinone oxidoreductase chain 6 n=1 Tax=Dastarcus helophoroides TaxID=1169899 RepID=A0A059SX13_9CUCU|nr:NADH dehydrogenase subunit 6 [Dastarcus helophoroides]AHG24988.1 NADH dehydrogenase subunit 6 [Dastarcus helophoroides]